MKNFSEWLNELNFGEKGLKDFSAQDAARKREKKGKGVGECPVCEEDPCTCKTAKINRLKRVR